MNEVLENMSTISVADTRYNNTHPREVYIRYMVLRLSHLLYFVSMACTLLILLILAGQGRAERL